MIEDENEYCRQSFIAGMKEAEKKSDFQNNSPDSLKPNSLKYSRLEALSKIKNNLQEADDYFSRLDKDTSINLISAHRLYYKVIQEGTGTPLDHQNRVSVHYTVKKPNDQIIANAWIDEEPNLINLQDTIPGFAWGIKGMKIGEIREIYIHPSVGYGIYTTLDKGIYLKALVQLVGIDNDAIEEPFPDFTILDLKTDISDTIDSDYQEESKIFGYSSGYQIWNHYKKIKDLPLVKVLEQINQFESGVDADISSEKNQNIINRLHWNIYRLKDYRP